MDNNIAAALVVVIELILRGACVFAILHVTLTLFKIDKAEKAEKERDAALTYVPRLRRTCAWGASCKKGPFCVDCQEWKFCGKTIEEAYSDDD